MELENLRRGLVELYTQRNQLVQLHILCTGEDLDSLETFIQIGPKTYRFKNLFDAVDSCFKIGVLFNSRFPIASNPVWQFFKLSVFGFKLDSLFASVA